MKLKFIFHSYNDDIHPAKSRNEQAVEGAQKESTEIEWSHTKFQKFTAMPASEDAEEHKKFSTSNGIRVGM